MLPETAAPTSSPATPIEARDRAASRTSGDDRGGTAQGRPAIARPRARSGYPDERARFGRGRPAGLAEAVERHAETRPDAVALRFGDETWSYGRLHQRAVELQSALLAAGSAHGDRVLLAFDRGPDLVAAVVGAMRAGATYVPIDPAHPRARIEGVIAQAAPRVALADAVGAACLPSDLDPIRVDHGVWAEGAGATLEPAPDASDASRAAAAFARWAPSAIPIARELAAYMLFTSGSTGRPKGVVIPHRALDAFLPAVAGRIGIGPEDHVLAATTIGFDISVLELHLPLFLGASVELVDEATRAHPGRLAARLAERPVTVVQATPTGFRLLIDAGWEGGPGLTLLCGGEAMTPELADALLARGEAVWNMYGPTECTVWATAHPISRADPTPYLGEPLEGTRLHVLGPDGTPADDGELVIAGPQVGTGYFRNPEKTAAAFVADPDSPEELAYRTGDRVERTPAGLSFRGRLDHQVKVGGVRVELGEVEAALEAHPDLAQCAVLRDPGRDALVAFVVPREGADFPGAAALAAHLEPRIYRAAWPAAYVSLDALPLTATGKIDRNALVLPLPEAAEPPAEKAPMDDLEWLVAKAWREVLGRASVGRDDVFVDLGGTSFKGLEVLLRLERWAGARIPTAAFVARKTVAEQASLLREARGPEAALHAVPLSDGASTPLFAVCGIHLYGEFAEALGDAGPVYGVSVPLERALHAGEGEPPSVEALADEVAAAIRAVRASGPYRLAGASFGGVIAYEAARKLAEAGETIEGVALFDTLLPGGVSVPPLRRLARRARHILAGALGPQRPGARDQAESRWNETSKVSLAGWLALSRARLEAPILVARATERAEGEAATVARDLGWGAYLGNPPDVVDIPGDHLGILRGEGAKILSEALRKFYSRRATGRT